MAKTLFPPPASFSQAGEGVTISAELFRYLASLDAAFREDRDRWLVPADAGAWPTLAQIPAGEGRLWKNGAALRFYANDGGTLRYLAFT